MRFILDGEMPPYLMAKDLILQVTMLALISGKFPLRIPAVYFSYRSFSRRCITVRSLHWIVFVALKHPILVHRRCYALLFPWRQF